MKRERERERELEKRREKSTRTFAPLRRAPSSIRISLSTRETGRSQYTRSVMGTATGSSVFARHPVPARQRLRVAKVVLSIELVRNTVRDRRQRNKATVIEWNVVSSVTLIRKELYRVK